MRGYARLRDQAEEIGRHAPREVAHLRQRRAALEVALTSNLAVLATARTVSETLIRTVADQATKRQGQPNVYGADARQRAQDVQGDIETGIGPLECCRRLCQELPRALADPVQIGVATVHYFAMVRHPPDHGLKPKDLGRLLENLVPHGDREDIETRHGEGLVCAAGGEDRKRVAAELAVKPAHRRHRLQIEAERAPECRCRAHLVESAVEHGMADHHAAAASQGHDRIKRTPVHLQKNPGPTRTQPRETPRNHRTSPEGRPN